MGVAKSTIIAHSTQESSVGPYQTELQCLNLQIPLRFSPKQLRTDFSIDTTAGTFASSSFNSCKKEPSIIITSHLLYRQIYSNKKLFEEILMTQYRWALRRYCYGSCCVIVFLHIPGLLQNCFLKCQKTYQSSKSVFETSCLSVTVHEKLLVCPSYALNLHSN